MWNKEKKAPIREFLAWTFLINIMSHAISLIGQRTGILSGDSGSIINDVVGTLIGGASPLYATYIVLKRHSEISGVREFVRRIFHTADIKKTLIVTTAFSAAMLLAAILVGVRTAFPWYIFIPAIPLMILGGGYEEIGWRGFMQPELEKRMPFIPAVLVSTVIWFAWHLPLWLSSFSNQSSYDLIPYALQLLVNTFALAAIYKVSRSTIACVMFHAWGNAIGALYEWSMFATFPISGILIVYYCVVIVASIIVDILTSRKKRTAEIDYLCHANLIRQRVKAARISYK